MSRTRIVHKSLIKDPLSYEIVINLPSLESRKKPPNLGLVLKNFIH